MPFVKMVHAHYFFSQTTQPLVYNVFKMTAPCKSTQHCHPEKKFVKTLTIQASESNTLAQIIKIFTPASGVE